jgi:hypothetical protein
MSSYAKSITAAAAALLSLAAARGVTLGFWVEAACVAVIAALAVYTVPNR